MVGTPTNAPRDGGGRLAPGDAAPGFCLPDQNGAELCLSSLAPSPVLLYFYPKAGTPGCTTQARALSAAGPEMGPEMMKVKVVGVSPDEVGKLEAFDRRYGLGFALVSDVGREVASAYGVVGERSMYGRKFSGIIRSAFLIDGAGTLVRCWYKISPGDTVPKLLQALGEGALARGRAG